MSLNQEQIKIIADCPLGDLLSHFPAKFRDFTESNETWRDDFCSLLGALLGSPAAYHLQSPDGIDNLADKLFAIIRKIREGELSLKFSQVRPLVDAVVANSPDTEIWYVVMNFIEVSNSSLPPSSIIPTGAGTPVSVSSNWLADTEGREIVERVLFAEIKRHVHRGVPGFFEKHFDSTQWTNKQKKMLKSILESHDGAKWKDFPIDPWEKQVWDWLVKLETALTGAKYKLHTNRTAHEFKTRKGQMDMFFRQPQPTSKKFEFKDILVVGEHKRAFDTGEFKSCLLQLTRYVRSIFCDLPMRRFVHAFTIRATTMELWIFDRSGAYSSGEFDIHDEPEKFARALVAYATMDDEAMGLDTSIELRDKNHYITVEGANGEDKRVQLESLLVKQCAIVCRGTTCFKSTGGVVKFSWRSTKRQPSEVNLLMKARERGVEGVATLVGHTEKMSIADLRAGLEFSMKTQHPFRPTPDGPDGHGGSQKSDTSRSSMKRKSSHSSESSPKRRSLQDNTLSPTKRMSARLQSAILEADDDETGQEANVEPATNMMELFTGPGTKLWGASYEMKSKSKMSLYERDPNEPYENRVLSCLVISPAGRVISDFKTIRELLEPLRDAIRAHQSLYTKGRILHRDISSNNIIITDPSEPGDFNGMLIDLDLAKERDSDPSGARSQTGTMQFMAIEVLRNVDHSYRHDLESFFYVLIWLCARCAWDIEKPFRGTGEVKPAWSRLRDWEIRSFEYIADKKEDSVSFGGMERIMREFPKKLAVVKPLCRRIRKILFPHDTEGRIMISTPSGNSERLYNSIILAFDEAISQL
ncbi:hypothetical protein QQS21_011070 [Conoideocrella luteorostrata]|uniref:EKC/KEOPS complex subunit BUD32 n=1 Tax=Conoideocrella luteorostrata TaxID=1105319 RepID=A0AAJ0CGK0_9HYPO|nr:hypothetical protein QQS21_011070 [Conoideocrella luteorostrata]